MPQPSTYLQLCVYTVSHQGLEDILLIPPTLFNARGRTGKSFCNLPPGRGAKSTQNPTQPPGLTQPQLGALHFGCVCFPERQSGLPQATPWITPQYSKSGQFFWG